MNWKFKSSCKLCWTWVGAMMTVRVGCALKGIGKRKEKTRQMLLVIENNTESIQKNFFSFKLMLVALHLHPCQTPSWSCRARGLLACPAAHASIWTAGRCHRVSTILNQNVCSSHRNQKAGESLQERAEEQSLELEFLMTLSMNSLRNKIIKHILVGFAVTFLYSVFTEPQWLTWKFSRSSRICVWHQKAGLFLVSFQEKARSSWSCVGEPVPDRYFCWAFHMLGQGTLNNA